MWRGPFPGESKENVEGIRKYIEFDPLIFPLCPCYLCDISFLGFCQILIVAGMSSPFEKIIRMFSLGINIMDPRFFGERRITHLVS
jgi:hypothetical protein